MTLDQWKMAVRLLASFKLTLCGKWHDETAVEKMLNTIGPEKLASLRRRRMIGGAA